MILESNSKRHDDQKFDRCLHFLNKLKLAGLLESKSKGLIIVADDQYVNLQAMRMAVEDVGISANDRLLMF